MRLAKNVAALLLPLLLLNAALAQECVCEWPSDYATSNDLALSMTLMEQVRDDSASVRRLVEVNTRELEELRARQWATSGEVENLSRDFNASIQATEKNLEQKMDGYTWNIITKIQVAMGQFWLLFLAAMVFQFWFTNTVYGWKHREVVKHAGVIPKLAPMTPREHVLVEELARVKKEEKEKRESAGGWGFWDKVVLAAKVLVGTGVFFLAVMLVAAAAGVI